LFTPFITSMQHKHDGAISHSPRLEAYQVVQQVNSFCWREKNFANSALQHNLSVIDPVCQQYQYLWYYGERQL
jgi:hypothetical protein